VFAYALFLTGDDIAARALQRAAFLDAHQALLLGGRLDHARAWLLRAVRDTADGSRCPAADEFAVLRRTCGLSSTDTHWVLGDDAPHGPQRGGRRLRIAAGAGGGAAMAARASTAKALAAQVPGFTAAGATGATHLLVASAVAGSALVGTAAITTKLEQRSHPAVPPTRSATDPHPRSTTGTHGDPSRSGGRSTNGGGEAGAGRHQPGTAEARNTRGRGATGRRPPSGADQTAGRGQAGQGQRGGRVGGTDAGQGSTHRTTPAPSGGSNPTIAPKPSHPARAPHSRPSQS
jgi:hypothetical protein